MPAADGGRSRLPPSAAPIGGPKIFPWVDFGDPADLDPREGKMRWYYALLSGILVIGFLIIMQDVMSLKWPKSLIEPLKMIGLA